MTTNDDITAEDLRRYLRAEGWGEGWNYDPRSAEDLRLAKNRRKVMARVARHEGRPLSAVAADVRRLRDEAQAPPDRVEAARNELIRVVREWQDAVGEDSLRRIGKESGEDREPAAALAVLEALEALDVAEEN
tara:strand:+ start:25152 stop:25550 length:399 start_codon:yes stop_codon:yes gene_type:complete